MFKQLGVVGCGLMGGSFALAMRRAGLVDRVIGYSKSPATTERARQLGVIDDTAESAARAVSGSDIVLIAVPVAATEATFVAIRGLIDPGAVIMDVGSTKADVADAARRVLAERLGRFVPAHPVAGKEAAGIDHADATLYSGRQVILTPLAQTSLEAVEKARETWVALGSSVVCMTPESHDAAFAAVSHLPHLLAFAYFNSVVNHPDGRNFLALAGPGFRDYTRIAAGDPAMWRDILIANREQVLAQSHYFRNALDAIEQAICRGDGLALQTMIRNASEGRSAWQMNAPAPGPSR